MKKLFTTWLLLALAVLGFQVKAQFVMPDFCTWQDGKNFVYIEDTNEWGASGINVYTWNGYDNGVWPGQANVNPTPVGKNNGHNVYLFDVPTSAPGNLIISNNGSNRFTGGNLTWTNGGYYNANGLQGVVPSTIPFDDTARKFAVTGAAVGGWNMPPSASQTFTNNGDGTYTWTGTVTAANFKLSGISNTTSFTSDWAVFNGGAYGKSSLVEGDNALSTSFGDGDMTMPVSGDVTLTISNVTATACNLNITVNQVIIPDPELYIAGTFTNWATDKLAMTYDSNDGSFTLTVSDIPDNAEFKFIDENGTWYGGASNYKVITRNNCTGLQLVSGDNFELPEGGNLTFTVDSDKKLSVSGWPNVEYTTLYVLGDFQSWEPNNGQAMAYDATNKIFTGTVNLNDEGYIKFTTQLSETSEWTIDEYLWGADSDGDFVVTESQLGSNLTLKSKGDSFKLPAGEWELTADLINGTLVIEGDWPVIPITDLYIAGSFTNWADGKRQMSPDGNGGFTLTVSSVPDEAEFKFIDQDGKWYGATPKSGDKYVVSIDDCTGIHILRDAGQNLKVSGAGNLTFTVDAHNNLTVKGWPGEGIPLAEALAGEAGEVVIKSDMAVVVSNTNYAIVSDGLGNWLKVTGQSLNVGDVIYRVAGNISGLDLNPVMAVSSYHESEKNVTVTPKSVVLVTATEEEITALKANEVAVITGYYNASEGKLFANRPGLPQGKCIAVTTSHMVGTLNDGVAVSVTGALTLKEAWETPADAPARAQKNNQGYLNYTLDASQSSPATGVDDVKVIDGKQVVGIYNVNGQQVKSTDHGVYIIRYSDGTAAKVRF